MKKLILIDANALVHRAFHALPPLTSPQGMIVNAVYGFTSVLLKTIKDMRPDYMAAAFDLAGPTFRHEEFEEYKAHRKKAPDELYAQIPLIKEVLQAFGVEIFEQEGFEADDLIGSVTEQAKKVKDLQTVILTGDLDTLQLVEGDKVVVFTLRKGVTDMVTYNEKGVKERYGLEPCQVVDFKGLKGDPSDNIPGVPGIGEKTAMTLLQKYGTIENLYKELKKIKDKDFKKVKSRTEKSETKPLTINPSYRNGEGGEILTAKLAEKLKENEKQAIFSKRLATIIINLDIDFSLEKVDWRNKYNKEKTIQLLRNLGFNSLLARLPDTAAAKTEPIENQEKEQKRLDLNEPQSLVIQNPDPKTLYLNGNLTALEKTTSDLKNLLEDNAVAKRGHNLKPIVKLLLNQGVHIKNLDFDTAVAAYLIKPELKNYDLDKLYFLEFGQSATNESLALPKLVEILLKKLKEKNLVKVFEEIEMPLIPVLAEMEKNGIKIDTVGLEKLSEKVNSEITGLEKKIYEQARLPARPAGGPDEQAGQEFNINSPQQLGEVLFDKLQLKTKVKKTSGGARSTAVSELEKLVDEHPIIELIMQYRELQKLKTTYIEPFPALINRKDHRVHTTYNQMGTVTGRLSSQDPNLQNIPIRTELGQEFRKAFVAEEGWQLLSLDYSQIELRIAAYLSGDRKMLEAFQNNEDIHTRTAAEVFEVSPDKVTTQMRRQAKALNFGILFGMGVLGFARSAGVDKMRAREFITKYLNKFSGMADYMEKAKTEAKEKGYVQTYFGRRRDLPEINSSMPHMVAQAERMAINAPIQGTEADIMKLAMIKVYNFIHGNKLEEEAKILLQVHDELLCEVREEKTTKIALKFKEIMENIWSPDAQKGQIKVPIVVDIKVGKNWSEMS
ncbi:MAG: DNA polymerase I [Candidatus Yanofskybacteria bacterium]|nr:DNA polymerase I [Candidatus Yanofskybacteria bacterium]